MDLQFILIATLAFIVVVVGLIVFHELGHYLAGRMFGLIPKAFSVGMGPELLHRYDKHGTRWKLCAVPIGGYVQFAGEMHPGAGTEDEAAEEHSFASIARWKRAVVIAAGPFANVLMTAIIFLGLTLTYGKPTVDSVIQTVDANTPAAEAGILPGDELVAVDGSRDFDLNQVIREIRVYPDHKTTWILEREGREFERTMTISRSIFTDAHGNEFEMGRIGVMFPTKIVKTYNPLDLIDSSVFEAGRLFKMQTVAMGQMVTGDRSLDEIQGPLRMAKLSGEQMMLGVPALLSFAAFISIAIAFMNLLPIPGLDGGYLALYAWEAVRGRNADIKNVNRALKGGYVAIGMLMIFAFSNDLRMLVS